MELWQLMELLTYWGKFPSMTQNIEEIATMIAGYMGVDRGRRNRKAHKPTRSELESIVKQYGMAR